MKKILFIFSFLLLTVTLNAQMTVVTYDSATFEEGVPINDGDIFAFNTIDFSDASIYFYIKNTSSEEIRVKIKSEEIVNADGVDFEFCFAELCIFAIEEGVTYPESGGAVVIPAGGTNVDYDHFLNRNKGDGTNYPMDYVFKFFRVDDNDNEIGESITFTYRYDPNLSTGDFNLNNLGVVLKNTWTSNYLNLETINPVQYQIFDLNGRLLQAENLASGSHTIGVSNLKSSLYLLVFMDNEGRKATSKFLKK